MPFLYHTKSQWSGNGILLPEMLCESPTPVVTNHYKLSDLTTHLLLQSFGGQNTKWAAPDCTLPQDPGGIFSLLFCFWRVCMPWLMALPRCICCCDHTPASASLTTLFPGHL